MSDSERPTVPLYAAILVAMAAGLIAGPFLGAYGAPLGAVGKAVIDAVKAIAAPLLFLAITNGVITHDISGRSAGRLLFFSGINATIALTIGLVLSNVLRPGDWLAASIPPPSVEITKAYADKHVDVVKTIVSYLPTNLVSPFADNVVLTLVGMALVFGFALRRVRREGGDTRVVEAGLATLLRVAEIVLGWVILLIPVAVFAVVAKTVAENGYAPFRGLAVYVAVGLLGLGVQALVTYPLWLVWVGMPLGRFWAAAREPVVTAIGTNSSLATLPVTLRALDRLGVSKQASTLGACVGTNFNNDGILLYEGMAVLFVAQAAGITLDPGQQVMAAATAMFAAIGVAGVPEAGFISLALVVNTVGLPIEVLPLLLTVDWVVARGRSVVNVLSDMVLSILIDGRPEGAPTDR
jgi:Na+/H+-dicarboxylate symporter